jgi:hypothetical protein
MFRSNTKGARLQANRMMRHPRHLQRRNAGKACQRQTSLSLPLPRPAPLNPVRLPVPSTLSGSIVPILLDPPERMLNRPSAALRPPPLRDSSLHLDLRAYRRQSQDRTMTGTTTVMFHHQSDPRDRRIHTRCGEPR